MRIVINNWRMDSSLNALIHCETGEVRRLGEYHFILLETLAKNADTVLSRSWLMAEVWKNRVVGGNSLPTAIHALRVAIDDDGKQQEIIKTIPKKGYLFNKSHLTIDYSPIRNNADNNSIANEETHYTAPQLSAGDETPAEQEPRISLADIVDNTVESEPQIKEKPVNTAKSPRYKGLFIATTATAIFLFLLLFIYHIKTPGVSMPPDAPQLVKEPLERANQIEVYHLYTSAPNKKAASLFSRSMKPGIEKLNALLVARHAKITLYYKVSLSKFTLDIVINNQCSNSRQLALSFENWQHKDNEMNNVMYQEVEKMLNEIPECK